MSGEVDVSPLAMVASASRLSSAAEKIRGELLNSQISSFGTEIFGDDKIGTAFLPNYEGKEEIMENEQLIADSVDGAGASLTDGARIYTEADAAAADGVGRTV